MARILILDASPEHCELFAQVVTLLGHEPVLAQGTPDLYDVDLMLVEPARELERLMALAIRQRRPLVPVVCISIYARSEESIELDPVLHLEKPCSIKQLEAAIETALHPTQS